MTMVEDNVDDDVDDNNVDDDDVTVEDDVDDIYLLHTDEVRDKAGRDTSKYGNFRIHLIHYCYTYYERALKTEYESRSL